jgi:hypothetical protein
MNLFQREIFNPRDSTLIFLKFLVVLGAEKVRNTMFLSGKIYRPDFESQVSQVAKILFF